MVTTLDNWIGSKRELSTNSGILLLNTRDRVQKEVSLSTIRLVIYSVTTSLIYKLDN